MPPRASSARTTSVNVPPMSTPILQLMTAHYTVFPFRARFAALPTLYCRPDSRGMTSLDLFRLDGQSAVVTGGAGGLGAAIARGLAEAGAAVCVADSNAPQATLVAEELARAG